MDGKPYLDAVKNILRIAKRFKNLQFIDFGGGYGIPYHKLDDEKDFPMEEFSVQLEKIIQDFVDDYKSVPHPAISAL